MKTTIVDHYAQSCARLRMKAIEDFCRSIGINESNASNVEIHTYQSDPDGGFIYWNDKQVGQFRTSISNANGPLKFSCTCFPVSDVSAEEGR